VICVGTACLFLLLGISIALVSILSSFESLYPQYSGISETTNKTRVFHGAELIPVSVSLYSTRDKQAIIEEFLGDQAILASRAALSFRQYPFVEVAVKQHSGFLQAKLVWQGSTGAPSESARITFNRHGVAKIFIPPLTANFEEEIESFALLFYDGPETGVLNNDAAPLVIESVRFSSWGISNALAYMWHRVSLPEHMGSHSNNIERKSFFEGIFSFNFALNTGLVTGLLLFLVSHRLLPSNARPSVPTVFTIMLVLVFSLLEASRWHWRVAQADSVRERYFGLPLEQRAQRHYARCVEFPDDCGKSLLPFY
jgi:hypothetical protein